MSKNLIDKTAGLQEKSFVAGQQFKLGLIGLHREKMFVLLPGKQMASSFISDGRTIDVFYYRALMLDSSGNPTEIDKVRLTDLVRKTYGQCTKDDAGEWLAAPVVGFTTSSKGNRVPESFGDEVSCGWKLRKAFVGKNDKGDAMYDGIIEEPQAFKVVDMQLHWVSEFDSSAWCTKETDDGHVSMRKILIPIIRPIDMPDAAKSYFEHE